MASAVGCLPAYSGLRTQDSMPVRQQTSHSAGFWQSAQRAVGRPAAATARSGGVATRRQVTRMMPIGVPRVPYRTPKEGMWQWVDIWNCLYRERIIFLSKPVDEELGNQLVATMLYLDSENKKDMNLYINCSGGEVVPSLAIHDTMRHIKSDVGTVGFGGCMGMSGFLLAVGKKGKRYALQNTRIMVHHPSGAARGQASDINREARELLRIRDYMDSILAQATGQPFEKVAQDFSRNKYFDTNEAQEYGLIDEVVRPRRSAMLGVARRKAGAPGATVIAWLRTSPPGVAQFKIEPFKHPLKLDPNYADNTWALLDAAIHEINNHNASGLSYEELYRNAYNMVVNKYGERLYNGLKDTETAHLHKVAARIEAAQGEGFLRALRSEWELHNKAVQMIRDILMYMDRIYVKQQNRVTVHQLGLDLWCDVVVRNARIRERLLGMLLDMVQRERGGEHVDRGLIRAQTLMLVDLGPEVYCEDFEGPFLERTAEFYGAEAAEYISSCDCPAYLAHAERRLQEEADRVAAYLDASTDAKVVKVVEGELIARQMRALVDMENSGLVALMQQDKHADLSRMYALFRRVDGGLDLLRQTMGDHLKETGKALVMDPERQKEPSEWVQRLLQEKEKYDELISKAFSSDKTFVAALNSAFEHFLNLSPRSPEYISLFMDDKLRKGLKGMSEDDIEVVLDKGIMLFRYLQEKDVFEKYYKQHLAKRLLHGRSSSEDAEQLLLTKLKTECGYQFTSKLETMFGDIKLSREKMHDFKAHLDRKGTKLEVDMSVQVLTSGMWPQTTAIATCNLPRELEQCTTEFSSYFLHANSGRRLTWQTALGTADIKAVFGNGSRKHEIQCSTYQMAVLLLFNDAENLSFEDIQADTKIPEEDLKRVLQSLACVKGKAVLRKEPMSRDVKPGDVFSVNDAFTSKLYKVKIGMVAAQRESEGEKAETREKVEEDRKPQIEAAIVRIMKSRKRLGHNELIGEVTRQLAARFLPQPQVVKKRIESLIDREFLERDATDRSTYVYLA
ncbi:cullin 3 [Micractinium conductrix]|uniref:Cullin 3 n=1 Tax=Micractinium conductrix TaxID=554055 RepID=A0A2P6V7U8_9CHLO|nr:cullin 3 [Micractinium conductrix]|eukprot:PSC70166.1 cullin 3 [Micractinium conductrix]